MSEPSIADVLRLLRDNEQEAGRTFSMVPSENAMSGLAKLPMMLDAYHRYFFNETEDPQSWRFRGGQRLAKLETQLAGPLLRQMTGAAHATLRPLSGLSAMTLVLAALGGPHGSTVLTIAPENGGHYATPSIAARLGLNVRFLRGPDPHELDYEQVAALVAEAAPTLVYVDQSHCLFPIDVAALVAAVRSTGRPTLVHVDVSHWLGLVLGGVFPNPLRCGADSFGGSTHKTFPGPQKAVFTTNRQDLADRVLEAQDYLISSHHFAATISLGLALKEFRDFGGDRYARAVVDNTHRFGARAAELGLTLAAADRGYSAGHQLWIDIEADGVPAMDAGARLYEAGLRVNAIPDLPGFQGWALRVGLNEPTWRGLAGQEIDELAEIFVLAVHDRASAESLRARVAKLRRGCRDRTGYGTPVEPGSPLFRQALALCAAGLLDLPDGEAAALDLSERLAAELV
ncbi:hypothetical protein [Nonomuraea guangzhouensis]|uniref:Serine hydroxymethyltransferase-like domain-containing protein n=1 Tax=Nonomuraea guangzhouensis TaxID=1291555 RepID=A0ABW4GXT2_9ACTN|nr:hypothetical protein [Nonomuraea guangzhouensis]